MALVAEEANEEKGVATSRARPSPVGGRYVARRRIRPGGWSRFRAKREKRRERTITPPPPPRSDSRNNSLRAMFRKEGKRSFGCRAAEIVGRYVSYGPPESRFKRVSTTVDNANCKSVLPPSAVFFFSFLLFFRTRAPSPIILAAEAEAARVSARSVFRASEERGKTTVSRGA